MKTRQRVTTKLSITYAVLTSLLILGTAVLFYAYNRHNIYQGGVSNVKQVAEAAMYQIDSRITNMEQVTVEVLGNNDFLQNWEQEILPQGARRKKQIRRILTKAYMNKMDIRRVAVFDREGNYICTGNHQVSPKEVRDRYRMIENYGSMNYSNVRVFMNPHRDFWDQESGGTVISEIKPIKNARKEVTGYIEVQQNVFYIRNICDLKFNGVKLDTMVWFGDSDDLLFSNVEEERRGEYIGQIREQTTQYTKVRDNGSQILFSATSNYYQGRLVCVLEKRILYKSLTTIARGIAVAGLVLIIVTIAYAQITTKSIMKPINLLVKHMADADIMHFQEQPQIKIKDRETEILVTSFKDMTGRFREAMLKQKEIEEVQTRTLFGVLQSEMGPHFLYNTLGGIANLCESGEPEAAADACYSLTDVLRYSSDYTTNEVTVEEEIEKLNAYLSIMKSRYRHRLEYEIITDEETKYFIIPKLTYQPLVENAIKYSLLESERVVIKVYTVLFGDQLLIEVKDNGCGISAAEQERIERRIREYRNGTGVSDIMDQLQIGGMGLIGTLIRYTIFFGRDFSYELLNNNDEGGTTIVLHINMKENK